MRNLYIIVCILTMMFPMEGSALSGIPEGMFNLRSIRRVGCGALCTDFMLAEIVREQESIMEELQDNMMDILEEETRELVEIIRNQGIEISDKIEGSLKAEIRKDKARIKEKVIIAKNDVSAVSVEKKLRKRKEEEVQRKYSEKKEKKRQIVQLLQG